MATAGQSLMRLSLKRFATDSTASQYYHANRDPALRSRCRPGTITLPDCGNAGGSVAGNADVGLIGLGVMGRNLALNLADHGYSVVVYNRTGSKTEEFISSQAGDASIVAAYSLEELAGWIGPPRRIILMVQAGAPVDAVTTELIPLLDPGDVIIDGGNSHFRDTIRRTHAVEAHDLLYVGAGISGGEEGARHGPSIMPGGSARAWPLVKDMLQAIAARVEDGTPCCEWVGSDGAGHFVKMVHNDIEYGDMQLIAEAYHLMHAGLGMDHDEMAAVFTSWNAGRLDSYLVGITADILAYRQDGKPLLDKILDAAGQKGTGQWAAVSALDLGTPAPLVAEAVFARALSALKEERTAAAAVLPGPEASITGDKAEVIDDLEQALYASKIVSYAQGFALMQTAAAAFEWDLDLGSIALLWRQGCIIRAVFLDEIRNAFARNKNLPSLLLDPFFAEALGDAQAGWRRTVGRAAEAGVPIPAYASALAFYDGYRSSRLPANLIQAQRDYFGAHTYERVDRPRGEFFHTDWSGESGSK
jgi:6-phosphogluconate dehydrogenase